MAKRDTKSIRQKRDGANGAIMLIPHVVLNSPAYKYLSGDAKGLLNDMAMQYNKFNNGALLASFRFMSENRGWTSAYMLDKSIYELIDHQLIFKTVQGCLPNKASWFGLTWYALDDIDGLEISAQAWPRGAYAHWNPPANPKPKRRPPIRKNTTSCP